MVKVVEVGVRGHVYGKVKIYGKVRVVYVMPKCTFRARFTFSVRLSYI